MLLLLLYEPEQEVISKREMFSFKQELIYIHLDPTCTGSIIIILFILSVPVAGADQEIPQVPLPAVSASSHISSEAQRGIGVLAQLMHLSIIQ